MKALILAAFLLLLPAPTPDPGYCGVGIFQTGKNDPLWKAGVCPAHDREFNAEINGLPNDGFVKTTENFIVGAAKVATSSPLGALEFLPYSFLVCAVGGPLWLAHALRRKDRD